MGLAVYNCITLDISFPIVCYRKLLASLTRPPPITITHHADNPASPSLPATSKQSPVKLTSSAPTPASSTHQLIGVVPVTLDDLKGLDPVSEIVCDCLLCIAICKLFEIEQGFVPSRRMAAEQLETTRKRVQL